MRTRPAPTDKTVRDSRYRRLLGLAIVVCLWISLSALSYWGDSVVAQIVIVIGSSVVLGLCWGYTRSWRLVQQSLWMALAMYLGLWYSYHRLVGPDLHAIGGFVWPVIFAASVATAYAWRASGSTSTASSTVNARRVRWFRPVILTALMLIFLAAGLSLVRPIDLSIGGHSLHLGLRGRGEGWINLAGQWGDVEGVSLWPRISGGWRFIIYRVPWIYEITVS